MKSGSCRCFCKIKKIILPALISAFIVIAAFPLLLTGCDFSRNSNTGTKTDNVTLIYYTIGHPDKDLKLVNDHLNILLMEKLGFKIDYRKIDWNDYHTTLSSLLMSGGDFDIAFAGSDEHGDFVGNAKKGYWLDLAPYLDNIGKDMYEAIHKDFWEGVTIDNHVYGVPTNKELAVPMHFIYNKELVDKYNIDITKYHDFASLEPLLALIAEKEPDYVPLALDMSRKNIFAPKSYEYVVSPAVPLMVNSYDETLQVVNIYETEHARELLSTLHNYFKKGYINADAPICYFSSLDFMEVKAFCSTASGGPYSANMWSSSWGYPVVSEQVSDPIIKTEDVQSSVMVVNAATRHPEECVKFLNLLNTDPETRNLINYGVKNIHYTLTPHDQVEVISDAYNAATYTQGNWFILKTLASEPQDKWEQFKKFNDSAVKSELFGFKPETSGYEKEISDITALMDTYGPALSTGSVDPEVYLPRLNEDLKKAGIEELKEELQRQINAWLQKKKM